MTKRYEHIGKNPIELPNKGPRYEKGATFSADPAVMGFFLQVGAVKEIEEPVAPVAVRKPFKAVVTEEGKE
jgi:hypothetical protein